MPNYRFSRAYSQAGFWSKLRRQASAAGRATLEKALYITPEVKEQAHRLLDKWFGQSESTVRYKRAHTDTA